MGQHQSRHASTGRSGQRGEPAATPKNSEISEAKDEKLTNVSALDDAEAFFGVFHLTGNETRYLIENASKGVERLPKAIFRVLEGALLDLSAAEMFEWLAGQCHALEAADAVEAAGFKFNSILAKRSMGALSSQRPPIPKDREFRLLLEVDPTSHDVEFIIDELSRRSVSSGGALLWSAKEGILEALQRLDWKVTFEDRLNEVNHVWGASGHFDIFLRATHTGGEITYSSNLAVVQGGKTTAELLMPPPGHVPRSNHEWFLPEGVSSSLTSEEYTDLVDPDTPIPSIERDHPDEDTCQDTDQSVGRGRAKDTSGQGSSANRSKNDKTDAKRSVRTRAKAEPKRSASQSKMTAATRQTRTTTMATNRRKLSAAGDVQMKGDVAAGPSKSTNMAAQKRKMSSPAEEEQVEEDMAARSTKKAKKTKSATSAEEAPGLHALASVALAQAQSDQASLAGQAEGGSGDENSDGASTAVRPIQRRSYHGSARWTAEEDAKLREIFLNPDDSAGTMLMRINAWRTERGYNPRTAASVKARRFHLFGPLDARSAAAQPAREDPANEGSSEEDSGEEDPVTEY